MLHLLAYELISEILRHFLPGLRLSVTKPQRFPWYLGEICSAWRTVFISSPQFWSVLYINIDECVGSGGHPYYDLQYYDKELRNSDHLFELVQVALKRSNGHPLSLSITMFHVFGMDSVTPLLIHSKDILEALVAHSMYWRDVAVIIHPSVYPLLNGAKRHLPMLRSASLDTYADPEIGFIDSKDFFMNATQLTRIHFRVFLHWAINWSLVTVIHIDYLSSLDEIISVFQQTRLLEEFVVENVSDLIDTNISPIHLPFMKILYVTPKLLSLFHAPGLEELYIRNSCYLSEVDIQFLKTIVSGCFNTIRYLRKLAIYPIELRYTPAILEEVPSSLQHLSLSGKFISKQLKFIADHPRLCNLEAISIATRVHEISYILATVKTWAHESQRTTNSGVGPFKKLAQFSLHFVLDKNSNNPKSVKRLKGVLEERSIKFVSRIIREYEINTTQRPSFDLL